MALLLPLVSPDPFLPQSLLTRLQRFRYDAARGIAEMFAVSIAAWLGSLPLMIYHFHLVTPIAPVANLLLIPIAFCVLGTAILSTLAGGIGLATLCSMLNNANFLWASTLTLVAGFAANLPVPVSHFYTGKPSILRPPCEITVLDIGRGGASTLISTKAGADWLVDTGHSRDFRRTVSAVLHEHAGVSQLDGIILTHADAAHIGAAGEVIDSFQPALIYAPPVNNSSSTYRSLAAHLDNGDRTGRSPRVNQVVEIDRCTKIRTLYSPGDSPRLSDDGCLVLLLESHGWRILLTGDAGFNTEASLLESRPELLNADLIIRGSHRADHSSTPGFLAAVQPSAVIVNARNYEDEGPGEDSWRKAMTQASIELFDQGKSGAVSIEIHPGELTIRTFKSSQSLSLKRER
jgi:competence protein ComEC